MSFFTTTINFADGAQVISDNLDEITSGLRLASDSADGTTITLSGGVLSLGTVAAGNIGANAVTTVKILDANVTAAKLATDAVETAKIKDAAVTAAKIAADAVAWSKTLPADRAAQADMQSATASHFVSPDVLKYHPGVAKAYGKVALENGVTTITGGYNVSGATDTGSGREITLSATMANTSYVVVGIASSGGTPVTVSGKTTTKFTLEASAETSGRSIEFVVYGQLA